MIGGPVSIQTPSGDRLYWSNDGTSRGTLTPIDQAGGRIAVESPLGDERYWRQPSGALIALSSVNQIPANALLYRGEPLTYAGEILTYGA